MKRNLTSFLVILLALIIANTGFARADVQLCQAECEYSLQNQVAPPPCCKTKKTVTPILAKVDHARAISGECPHFGSNREIPDPLQFTASTYSIAPHTQPVVFALIPTIGIDTPDTRFTGHYTRTGLSPPEIKNPPVYRLNCSLLI